MRIEIVKDQYIQIRNPKLIDNLLVANGLSSTNPAVLPYVSSFNIDITTAADDACDACQKEWYNSTVGVVRYLADTTQPETGYVLAKLARALSNPCMRHVKALKHLLRYLLGVRECGLRFPHKLQTSNHT